MGKSFPRREITRTFFWESNSVVAAFGEKEKKKQIGIEV